MAHKVMPDFHQCYLFVFLGIWHIKFLRIHFEVFVQAVFYIIRTLTFIVILEF